MIIIIDPMHFPPKNLMTILEDSEVLTKTDFQVIQQLTMCLSIPLQNRMWNIKSNSRSVENLDMSVFALCTARSAL